MIGDFTRYCLGFMLSPDRESVVLIKKTHPTHQAGKLNGIGGKVEDPETGYMAMAREFFEETGIQTDFDDWTKFANINGPGFWIGCYYCCSKHFKEIKTMTEEKVMVLPIDLNRIVKEGVMHTATLLACVLSGEKTSLNINTGY